MKNFIVDEEIDLLSKKQDSNENQNADFLNTMTYVKTLTDCVCNAPKDKPITIGLFGSWGSGKSSIIKTFRGLITEKYKERNESVKVITYDAWKYANDSFRRMFLLQMQEDLGFEQTPLMQKFYINTSEDVKINTQIKWKELAFGGLIILCVIVSVVECTDIKDSHKIVAAAFISLASLVLAILRGAFKELKVNIQQPHLFAPEQFEECFDEMCKNAQNKKSSKCLLSKYILKDGKCIDRLIIVIDNIDRCTSELAYELLTNIKNFLGNKHNIIFIVPVDDNALKKHIVNTKGANNNADEEFLRKFFNICIRIKPFQREEMFDFADSLNKKYNLGFEPTTVSLVANEFAKNPRRIIQLFNNLTVELDTMPEAFAKKHQVLICLLLIIREEYQDFYQMLQEDSSKLVKYEELDHVKKELRDFLGLNQAVLDTYASDVLAIERILSNSIVFNKIPEKLKNDYLNKEYCDESKQMLSEPQNRKNLVGYIERSLNKAIQRQLWDTDVKNTIERIIELSKEGCLSKDDYLRLTGRLKENVIFKEVADRQKSLHSLIEWASIVERLGISTLTSSLIQYMNSEENGEYNDKFDIWYACQKFKPKYIDSLKKMILKASQKDINGLISVDFGENSSYVYTNDVIDLVVGKIKEDENKAVKCMTNIASKINIQKNHVVNYVKALNEATPAYNFNTDNSNEIIDKLCKVNDLLSLIKPTELGDISLNELKLFYEKFNKENTSVMNIGYNRKPVKRSFVIDNKDKEEAIDAFITFIYETSRLTKNIVVEHNTVQAIIENGKYNQILLEKFKTLFDMGYPIEKYGLNILSINDYTDSQLVMIDYLLKHKEGDGSFTINDNDAKRVLERLFNLALKEDNESKAEYVAKIKDLILEQRNADVLSNILLEKDKEWLLALPSNLSDFAIKIFEEHFEDYKEHQKVLILLASKGSKNIKKTIIGIVNNKINDDNERNNGFEIILSLNGLNKKDLNPIYSSLEYLKENKPEFNDVIEECQKHLEYNN